MTELDKDRVADMEVCTLVVVETCNRFQKEIVAGDEEEIAFSECPIMAYRDECTVVFVGLNAKGLHRGSC